MLAMRVAPPSNEYHYLARPHFCTWIQGCMSHFQWCTFPVFVLSVHVYLVNPYTYVYSIIFTLLYLVQHYTVDWFNSVWQLQCKCWVRDVCIQWILLQWIWYHSHIDRKLSEFDEYCQFWKQPYVLFHKWVLCLAVHIIMITQGSLCPYNLEM